MKKNKLHKIVLLITLLPMLILLHHIPHGQAEGDYLNYFTPISLSFPTIQNFNYYDWPLYVPFNSFSSGISGSIGTPFINQSLLSPLGLNFTNSSLLENTGFRNSSILSLGSYLSLHQFGLDSSSLFSALALNNPFDPFGIGSMPPSYSYPLSSISGYSYPASPTFFGGMPQLSGSLNQFQNGIIGNWQFGPGSAPSHSSPASYTASYAQYGSYGGGYSVGYPGSFSGYSGGFSSFAYGGFSSSPNIGYSTGGAKDINNFRTNIEENYLPIPTDITYEGLFYDYYFDTGQQEECQNLFCPSYSLAVTQDPFSGEEECYMSVGLNSGIRESDFQRKRLNLVIVLDISGSMGSSFNTYYYDQYGNKHDMEASEYSGKSKINIATESIVALLDHLGNDDRFGMVLFESAAFLAEPITKVGDKDMQALKDYIFELTEKGSTNMEAGMREGTKLFQEYLDVDPSLYENRIIFLTDAMPNTGTTSQEGLLGMMKENADKGIYSTFIGIGVDLNTELVEYITKIRGANYYSVHSSSEFKERMDEGFDYMVTPLVFNLVLKLESQGYQIEKVYGSPEANEATGELMKVNTLFPSQREEEGTKGGIVLLKLRKISGNSALWLTVTYEDREGNTDSVTDEVEFSYIEPEYFANTGIRKAILLSRYGDLMKNWIIDERKSLASSKPIEPSVSDEYGIVIPCTVSLGEWERQSAGLVVSDAYQQIFSQFKNYFEQEMVFLSDNTPDQELSILEKLSTYKAN